MHFDTSYTSTVRGDELTEYFHVVITWNVHNNKKHAGASIGFISSCRL